jgi:hypothetical protein
MSANREDCLRYSTIVFTTTTLPTLEGISRKGHMKSLTQRLEQKLTLTIPKGLFPLLILFVEKTNFKLAAYLLVGTQSLVWYDVIKPRDI